MAANTKSMYRGQAPVDVPLYSFTDFARFLRLPSYDTFSPTQMKRPDFFPLGLTLTPVPGLPRGFTGTPLDPVFSFRQLVEVFLMSAFASRWLWGYGNWAVHGKRWHQPDIILYFDRASLPEGADPATWSAKLREAPFYSPRVDYGEGGTPVRLYPFTRPKRDEDSPKLIALDPRFGFGKPIVARRHVPVDVIGGRFRAGESVAELAEDYELTPLEVEEAIRFDAE